MSDLQGTVFRDPEQALSSRVADLLGRLTLAEKVALLHQHQAPVPRLGMERFKTGTEALHGVAWLGPATVFPQALGLASTWDSDLVRRVGAAVGDEVRGYHHKDPERAGLNVWAPVVNPLRDPRWGRNEEGYAEDPWLTGLIGTAYARGLRGDHPFYLRTAPTLKHFLAYNNETDRALTSSNLPPRVLHEYELPAFRAPLAAGAAVAVMASYNLVNGVPTHLSPLIGEVLRGFSDEEIMVVGDAAAVSNLAREQRRAPDHVAGFAAALRAGVDCMTEDGEDSAPTIGFLTEALDRGLIDESHVDAAVRRILSVRFRLGEFDPPERNPYAAITADTINRTAHQELAREAARASVVLLRNECGPILPLAPGTRVAVIGPLGDAVHEDWYSGGLPYQVTPYRAIAERVPATVTEGADRVALKTPGGYVSAPSSPGGGPLRGDAATPSHFDVLDYGYGVIALRAAGNGRVAAVFEPGGPLVNDQPGPNGWEVHETFDTADAGDGRLHLRHRQTGRWVALGADGLLRASAETADRAVPIAVDVVADGVEAAVTAAADADVAVVVLGNHPLVNGRETEDRPGLGLPAAAAALLRAVYAANRRTVLVLTSSYPYALGALADRLPAVLWSAHGGQEHGTAIADVLFGADAGGRPVDPAGRLTQTWYRSEAELPDLLDYDIVATDATYLYYRGAPLFPFGHGLSYTRFGYRDLRLSAASIGPDDAVEVSVEVTNAGDRDGVEVVQLYTRQQRSRVKQPLRALRGFARVRLAAGESTRVTLPLRAADLAFWDVTRGRPVIEAARHTVAVGRSSADPVLTTTLTVRGERIPDRDPGATLRAADNDDYDGVLPVRHDRLASVRADAWAAFERVAFGGQARVRVRGTGPGTVTLRLDDPAGPVIGTVALPAGDAPAEVTAPVESVDGVRDLFLVYGGAGITVSEMTFTAAERGIGG
ncbi:glycoside hydrolase family 3 C-terminal domain-containing protein [Catenuloplanes atrovinosus]|uniref:Exo-alpha-(1->6)-L-arabinopyranosidase n=1 Tax=Catenuloplanes atrovinosus TaxID=137266 RepID=A0AAE3YT03_9ACTN|nr:glycoside hydrolase family 3 C-terminal domain-containing protein [Catenuloplanes atrovinosus]MDR7278086.1 beta-glucosidase [Catenuloplanes atrovinosus]